MSTKTNKLNELLEEQQSILNSIKAEALELDAENITKQNEKLTAELSEASNKVCELKIENDELKKELYQTKSALFAKLAQEKLYVFESKQRQLEKIYYNEEKALGNRLDAYVNNCTVSIKETIKAIESYGNSEFDDILAELNEIKSAVAEKKASLDAYKTSQLENAAKTNFEIGNELKQESLTQYEINSAKKQKSIESFIGLNILSKAGILLFIIGIIMLGRFAYVHMSDTLKGVLIYMLGGLLIGVGELFHKKEKTVFSTTLMSGGVATLYAACATSYFAFNLYGVKATFIICIIITAVAIALSKQIKSQIVCCFAGVGGYLPVVALYMIGFGKAAADITFIPVSSVYFCVLAVIIFAMTYNKKWYAAQYIGYSLHLIAIGGIAKCAYTLRTMAGYEYALPLAVVFSIASFAIYLLMPATKIIKRKPFLTGDLVLLILNTVSGALSVSITVRNCISNNTALANRVMGFVFLAFAIIYVVLMIFSSREKKENSKIANIVTSLSALIFSMLVVPLVFGMEYTAIAWSAEGVVLALISMEKRLKVPEFAGLFGMLLSIPVAVYFSAKDYSAVSIITFSVIISAFWLYVVRGLIDVNSNGKLTIVYQALEILTAFASAGYLYYLYTCILRSPMVNIYSGFTSFGVEIIAAMLAIVILRVGIFKNKISVLISDIAGILLFFAIFIGLDIDCEYDAIFNIFNIYVKSMPVLVINIIMLVLINVMFEILFARCVFDLLNRTGGPAWIFTMAISASTIAIITAVLLSQFGVPFTSVILSAVYIACACLLLFIGFKRNYTVVRSSGLVLVLCAFAKLCFGDTRGLDSGWKIGAYFVFGALLILISFFYQRFAKKLENE